MINLITISNKIIKQMANLSRNQISLLANEIKHRWRDYVLGSLFYIEYKQFNVTANISGDKLSYYHALNLLSRLNRKCNRDQIYELFEYQNKDSTDFLLRIKLIIFPIEEQN